jgi:hypothetical protein
MLPVMAQQQQLQQVQVPFCYSSRHQDRIIPLAAEHKVQQLQGPAQALLSLHMQVVNQTREQQQQQMMAAQLQMGPHQHSAARSEARRACSLKGHLMQQQQRQQMAAPLQKGHHQRSAARLTARKKARSACSLGTLLMQQQQQGHAATALLLQPLQVQATSYRYQHALKVCTRCT